MSPMTNNGEKDPVHSSHPPSLAELPPEAALAASKQSADAAKAETKNSNHKLWLSLITFGVLLLFSPLRTFLALMGAFLVTGLLAIQLVKIEVQPKWMNRARDRRLQRQGLNFWFSYTAFWILWVLMQLH